MNASVCHDCQGLWDQVQQRVLFGSSQQSVRLAFSSFLNSCVNYTTVCAAPVTIWNGGPQEVEADASGPGGLPPQILGVSVSMPFVAACLLVLLAMWLWRRPRGHKRRTLWGRVKAPTASEDSTLVISDIENSTQLWEILDESVMDTAISLHHGCFREHIRKCVGYEAEVQGDSFCVCFHNPNDAAYFSVTVQMALMQLDWPEELLNMPECAAVWISHTPSKNAIALPDHRMSNMTGASEFTQANNGVSYNGTEVLQSEDKLVQDTQVYGLVSSDGQIPKLAAVYDPVSSFSGAQFSYSGLAGPTLNLSPLHSQPSSGVQARGSFESEEIDLAKQRSLPNQRSLDMTRVAPHGEQLIKARLRKSKDFSTALRMERTHSDSAAPDAPQSREHVTIDVDEHTSHKPLQVPALVSRHVLSRAATQGISKEGSFSLVEKSKGLRSAFSQKLPSPDSSSVTGAEPSGVSGRTQSFIKPNIRRGPRRMSSRLQWADLVMSKSHLSSELSVQPLEPPAELLANQALPALTQDTPQQPAAPTLAASLLATLQPQPLAVQPLVNPPANPLPTIAGSPTSNSNPSNVIVDKIMPSPTGTSSAFHSPRDVLLSTAMAIPEGKSSLGLSVDMMSSEDLQSLANQHNTLSSERCSNQSQLPRSRTTVMSQSANLSSGHAYSMLVGTMSTSSLAKYQLESVIESMNGSGGPSGTPQQQQLLEQLPEGVQGWTNHTSTENSQPAAQFTPTPSGWLHKLTEQVTSFAQRARTFNESEAHTLKQAAQGIQVYSASKAKLAPPQAALQDTDTTAPGAVQSDQDQVTTTVGRSLQARCFVVSEGDPGAKLAFRGLRVRIGCHSGLTPDDYQYNKATSRMLYNSGQAYQLTKAVCDAACGGMILLSEQCHNRFFVEDLQHKAMVFHMGDHRLKGDMAPMSIHQLVGRSWMGRLPLLAPVRSHCTHSLGALDAPAGFVTVCFMHVVGEATLQAWNSAVAAESLALFQLRAGALLHKHKGYMMEGANGFILASFSRVTSGVRWALQCVTDLKRADWPEELLSHELGEEMVTRVIDPATGVATESIMLRGLRIKAGLDCGRLRGEVNCITGRMTYRGRYMNRAARISAAAGTGQVLASADVHNAFSTSAGSHLYVASSMGFHRFKGVQESVEVFDIQPSSSTLMTKRGSLALTRASQEYTILRKDFDNGLVNQSFHMSRLSKHQSRPSNLGPGNPPRSRPASGASYSHGPSRAGSFKDLGISVRRSLLMLGIPGVGTQPVPRAPTPQSGSHTRTSATSCRSHFQPEYSPRTSAQGMLSPKFSTAGPGHRSSQAVSHNGVLSKGRRESTILMTGGGSGQHEDYVDTDSGGSRRGYTHAGHVRVQTVMTQNLHVHQGQGSHVIVVEPSRSVQKSTSAKWMTALHQPGATEGLATSTQYARSNSKGQSDSGVLPGSAIKQTTSGGLSSHSGNKVSMATLAVYPPGAPSDSPPVPMWLSGGGSAPGALRHIGTASAIDAPTCCSTDSVVVADSGFQGHACPANAFAVAGSVSDQDSSNRDSFQVVPYVVQPRAPVVPATRASISKEGGSAKATGRQTGGTPTVSILTAPTRPHSTEPVDKEWDKDWMKDHKDRQYSPPTFHMLTRGSTSGAGGRQLGEGDSPVLLAQPAFMLTSGRRGSTASVPDPNHYFQLSLPARKSLDTASGSNVVAKAPEPANFAFMQLHKSRGFKRSKAANVDAGNLLIVHGDSTDEETGGDDDDADVGEDGRVKYNAAGLSPNGAAEGQKSTESKANRFVRVLRQASVSNLNMNIKRMTQSIAGSVHDRQDRSDDEH